MRTIVTGDDVTLQLTLYEVDSAGTQTAVEISGGADVAAVITSPDGSSAWSGEVALDDDHDDSDWANGIVVVQIPAATTDAIERYGHAALQVMVDDGGRTTWLFPDLQIVQGQVA